jgi:hypothetical protein
LEELSKLPNCVVNANLNAVKGYPPHYWKLVDGKVCLRDESEVAQNPQDPPIPIRVVEKYIEVPVTQVVREVVTQVEPKIIESVRIVLGPMSIRQRAINVGLGTILGIIVTYLLVR